MSLLVFETPVQNTFSFFGLFDIYYYAVMMVLAILIAALLSMLIMHRRNVSIDLVLTGFIVAVPTAIVGARLFACISETNLTIADFFRFREGGMSIMGALIGGFGSVIIFCLVKKLNFFRVADCVLPTLPIAQAIGRWGNYFNQEVYGGLVADPKWQFFPVSVLIEADGQWHYAFFFFESVANTLWFVVLFLLAWNFLKKPNGLITGLFCLFYGILRAVMEPLRDAQFQYGEGQGVDTSLVMSFILIAVGALILLYVLLWNKRKEGKLIGSKYADEYTVSQFVPCEKGELPLYSDINAATRILGKGNKKSPEQEK